MDENGHNKVETNNEPQDLVFHYNFINTPWDDRSNRSKTGIVALLAAIFVATMGCVVHNFVVHYRGFKGIKSYNNSETSCFKAKMSDYQFVARIHSVASQELLCVGAVVSSTAVLANGVCVKAGPIRMHLGNPTHPRCKKGFPVDIIESMYHDGVVSRRLVLLSSYENIDECSEIIDIGRKLNWKLPVKIIGRPVLPGRFLSEQHVNLAETAFMFHGGLMKNINLNHTICVGGITHCPVRAGDLMLQGSKLFGLAATSVHRNRVACFCDLNFVKRELKELDAEIKI